MELLHLAIQDFRNLVSVELTPSRRATVAVGQNGQGKTNLLEALYVLATLKPLRGSRLSELIRFGQGHARVTGKFLLSGATRDISVDITPGARQASVDGKRAARLEDYFGGVSVVAFTPEDLAVVKGGPDGRRGFLDRAVFNRFPVYLKESRDYLRALKSRNTLLKQHAAPEYLDAYNVALARTGSRVLVRRRALMAELAPRAEAAFHAIAKTGDPARYDYAPTPFAELYREAEVEALETALLAALEQRTRRDRERGFTSVGPHTDDLTLELGGRSARSYASQGQQRAFVLAWKVAEIENLSATLGYQPLLLLDDVSSELDPERNAYLMHYLAACGAQVFLTTTEASLVSAAAGDDTLWCRVEQGRVSRSERSAL